MDEATTRRATEYAELDVSDWPRSGREELGTKPKRWLTNPNSQERWLMKYATFNELQDNLGYRKGDDWAERIAYGVAQVLGIPAETRTTYLARHQLHSRGVGRSCQNPVCR